MIGLFGLLLLNVSSVNALKTDVVDENHSFETAFLIEDHPLSKVSFQELKLNKQNYYAFEGNANEKFFMEMIIPENPKTAFFTPEIVFMGTPSQIINISKQLQVCTTDSCSFKVKQIGYKLNDPNAEFPIPSGYRGLLISYDGELPSKQINEPLHLDHFLQTTFYQRQGVEFTLPETSWYWIVVFDDDYDFEIGNKGNKYALVTGYIDDWDLYSWIIDFPRSWYDFKVFTNDSTSILILFSVMGIIALAVMYRSIKK